MSGARNTIHPGFLRKVAVISICGGLVIGAALFGLRFVPMLVGLSEWAGVEARFIPLVDGLFVIGLAAHLGAMFIVVRDRNPGLGRFVRRSLSRPSTPVQVVAPDGGAGYTEADLDSDLGEESEEPEQPLDRVRATWAQLRSALVTRRGRSASGADEPVDAAKPVGPLLLGGDAAGERTDAASDVEEADDDGR